MTQPRQSELARAKYALEKVQKQKGPLTLYQRADWLAFALAISQERGMRIVCALESESEGGSL